MAKATKKALNVRIDSNLYDALEVRANELGKNKSEVVRTIFAGYFLEGEPSKTSCITDGALKELLEKIGKLSSVISDMRVELSRVGNNMNQIAKHLNSGNVILTREQEKLLQYNIKVLEKQSKWFEMYAEVVHGLWRILE